MRCLHCGSAAGRARPNELTVAECLDVADQLTAMGCTQATLIGGEVFLYRGWEGVARRLVEGGARVNIITNGFLMSDEQVRQIRRAGLANVGISLDGMEANHNRIRDVRTSFARVLEAMRRLRAAGVSIGAVTSLLDFNVADLPDMYDLLLAHGVEVWQLQIATAMGSLADGRPMLLRPEKVPGILRFMAEKRAEAKMDIYAGDDLGYYDEREVLVRSRRDCISVWQGCQAGLRVVGIDSVGNVKGCESLYDERFIEGNLRSESLAEIWRKPWGFAYNRRFRVDQLAGPCAGCEAGATCRGGCRGACYFTTGNLYHNIYCVYPAACEAKGRTHRRPESRPPIVNAPAERSSVAAAG